ncbi:MEDS domain-containing protein [Sinomonas sp. ASV486]|uniref:MEDS domain-containing protein n=1 Tax=Sinomonas sp. ASV486 TaxID=3051170 RepID=UPI0027DB58EA|nr:MEDS domain-containing protein [Sinomonas sp. ASV486]MDQ4491312.1 MEDS domain-containing protein [Sinomonas sp. ASV486]
MNERIHRPRREDRWPVGHLGWAFMGLPEFEGRVASFLVEGHARGERQVFIVDDPRAALWPKGLVERGDLLIFSTAEAYGQAMIIDAAAQRAAFESSLAQAIELGYTGLRIAADNTSLTLDPERLEAWMRWEEEAELLMQAKPITGLCAFDRTRSDAATIKALMSMHPVAVGF